MLHKGDSVPHFTVADVDGRLVVYSDIWQRKHLVLALMADASERDWSDLSAVLAASCEPDTACVVSRDAVDGVPSPGVVVADRWGEIAYVAAGRPDPREITEWIDHLRHRCPECEGEAK